MRLLETALVVAVTPLVSFGLWKLVKAVNRRVQRLIPEGRLKRALNTRVYQGLGEVEDQRRS